MKYKVLIGIIITLAVLVSCGNDKTPQLTEKNQFETLIEYIEAEADYLNAESTPFFISAPDVYQGLKKNFLIIDVRNQADYDSGHIQNSINIIAEDLVNYFETKINPGDFEKIVLIDNAGMKSSFCAMSLRYLGYENVFPLKYGLSSWDKTIAENYRLKNRGDILTESLDTTSYSKNAAGDYPKIMTTSQDAVEILKERVKFVLAGDFSTYYISIEDLLKNPSEYYIVSYWPLDRYEKGHIPGSIQYKPKSSLKSSEFLSTLPVDKKIVIDCYAGNHSNFVVAYLRILGYDALSLQYGANAYMFTTIVNEERASRSFTENDIYNLPLIKTNQGSVLNSGNQTEEISKPKPTGGC